MSLEGQLHALPRRSIAVRFTSVNRPRSERGGLVPRRGVIGSKVPRRPYGEEASIVLEQLPRVDLKSDSI
jgi:hypothetical protein